MPKIIAAVAAFLLLAGCGGAGSSVPQAAYRVTQPIASATPNGPSSTGPNIEVSASPSPTPKPTATVCAYPNDGDGDCDNGDD